MDQPHDQPGLTLPRPNRPTANEVEIIAHRGASHIAPENTLAAINLAWTTQANAVEIDIRLTADGRIALCHDPTTKRICPGNELTIAQTPLQTLQTLDVGGWKGRRWAGETMPTLTRVLPTVPAGKRLFIEIKSGPEIVPVLGDLLRQSGEKPEPLVLISFSLETLKEAGRTLPDHPVYWLSRFRQDKESGRWRPTVEQLIEQAREAGVDGVDLSAAPVLDQQMIRTLHEHGLKVYAWTVDDPQRARRLAEDGIDGITTNRPQWLGERL